MYVDQSTFIYIALLKPLFSHPLPFSFSQPGGTQPDHPSPDIAHILEGPVRRQIHLSGNHSITATFDVAYGFFWCVMVFFHLQDSAVILAHADLTFTVLLLNADSAGNPLEHFSAEEAGQGKKKSLNSVNMSIMFLFYTFCSSHVV